MKYRTCPLCGCNIDYGERDEAKKAEQNAGEYADAPTLKEQQSEPVIMPGA